MKHTNSLPKLCRHICKRYLRYSSAEQQKLYTKALLFFMTYNDKYLFLEGIDLALLNFLAKIIRNNYTYPKVQVTNLSESEIEELFSSR